MKVGPCPSEFPSKSDVMACASSCSRHQDGICAGRKIESRVALASVALDWLGSGSTLGGYFNPVSVQIASTIDWARA